MTAALAGCGILRFSHRGLRASAFNGNSLGTRSYAALDSSAAHLLRLNPEWRSEGLRFGNIHVSFVDLRDVQKRSVPLVH
jgi:hypothetical protein